MSTLQLSGATMIAALLFLGVEAPEGDDPSELLDTTLADYNLDRDDFLTKQTLFACGFHRGLTVRSYDPEVQVPTSETEVEVDGTKTQVQVPDVDLNKYIENGYAFGLEARDLKLTPPPNLVFAAFEAGEVSWGGLSEWAATLDLSEQHRLGSAVEIGSGKNAIMVPAGTPIDIIGETEKDGVPHVIVGYDGMALLIPNPEDAPKIVTGDTLIATTKKKRARKAGSTTKKTGVKRERGPTLKTAIIFVLEGGDGGPGPLQSNGAFAGCVLKKARELGIGDKAGKFVQKAAEHVPYYINCYAPKTKDNSVGRLGVEAPKVHVVAQIRARKYFNKAEGTFDEKFASIPEELRLQMEDKDAVLTTVAAPTKTKETPPETPPEAPTDGETGNE